MKTLSITKSKSSYYKGLTLSIDGIELCKYFASITHEESLKNLAFAWMSLNNENEKQYIQRLLDKQESCRIPILICPDDLDLWCTVVSVKVEFLDDFVVWKKLGFFNKNYDIHAWKASGYQNIETWTLADFERFDEDYLKIKNNKMSWHDFSNKHWLAEEKRRIENYIHPLFQDDSNFDFLDFDVISFKKTDYLKILETIKMSNSK